MTGRGSPLQAAAILAGVLLACDPAAERAPEPDVSAHYIAAEDGTRLAADVYLPAEDHEPPHPALLTLTRYRRGLEDPDTGERINTLSGLDSHFLAHGYALVKVDARGSGASFGTRPVEYGRQEVLDAYDVVDWVVAREWSDGTVGAYGTSYTGTTAELLAAVNHPAVNAVIPGWSDFDAYPSPIRPYGLLARGFIETWGDVVGHMDDNNAEAMGAGVARVDEDEDGSLLAAAVAEHAANPDVFQVVLATEYRDDVVGGTRPGPRSVRSTGRPRSRRRRFRCWSWSAGWTRAPRTGRCCASGTSPTPRRCSSWRPRTAAATAPAPMP